ncbi:hypothetical protein Hanom_Chr09g00780021 [Helianthus anomalus]
MGGMWPPKSANTRKQLLPPSHGFVVVRNRNRNRNSIIVQVSIYSYITYTPHNRRSAMAAFGGAKTLTSSSSSATSVSQFWSTLPLRSSSQFLQGQIIRSLFTFEKELSNLQVFVRLFCVCAPGGFDWHSLGFTCSNSCCEVGGFTS